MSQIDCNQATANNKKTYHSPQLKKFGKVSELTLTTQTFVGSDGGSGINQYSS
ncbi:MAG: hypothetical protein ACFB2X_16145 [Rivularia sp. (in: cyanobacteria)]